MELVAKMDHYGKPAWITLMVVGFVLFWPIGLAILAYLIWSGRMGFWKHSGPGRWYYDGARRQRSEGRGWCGSRHRSGHRAQSSSGNLAFDEYREETLRRLEEERGEFESFLERLRHAKDKAEFDQFMDERSDQGDAPPPPEAPEEPPAHPAG
jgi:hypothetical protein